MAARLNTSGWSKAPPVRRPPTSVVAEAHHVWHDLFDRGRLHRWAAHPRSSQALAINLFGPIGADGARRLLEAEFGAIATADVPVFEFEDDLDRLHEATAKRPHRTQVDVLLRGTTADGVKVALLVEVKFTEDDFGHCSAAESEANDRLDVCRTPGPFGSDVAACFQLRNHGNGERRRYDQFIPVTSMPAIGVECSFRRSASQPMRNLALAGVLEAEAVRTRFALCAPGAAVGIWRRWDDARAALNDDRLVDLPAEEVVALHAPLTARWMRDRYELRDVLSLPSQRSAEWLSWATVDELTSTHAGVHRVMETHPAGGQYDCLTLCGADRLPLADLNRAGSAHIRTGLNAGHSFDVFRLARRSGPGAATQRLAFYLGLRRRAMPITSPWSVFAAAVSQQLDDGRLVEWRCGLLDTSSGVSVRRDLYAARGERPPADFDGGDVLEHPGTHDWFCVDHAGAVHAEARV